MKLTVGLKRPYEWAGTEVSWLNFLVKANPAPSLLLIGVFDNPLGSYAISFGVTYFDNDILFI